MAKTYKCLGQSKPAATTGTDLYTVPAATQTVVSSLVVCNQSASTRTFRVSISVAGGATVAKDYLYYDVSLPANDTFVATLGLAMQATDKMRVYASTTDLSFNLFGAELT